MIVRSARPGSLFALLLTLSFVVGGCGAGSTPVALAEASAAPVASAHVPGSTPAIGAAPSAPPTDPGQSVAPSTPPPSQLAPTPVIVETPIPTAVPTPTPVPVVYDPPPRKGKFSLDLNKPGAFVPQFDTVSCVASAMQTMINVIEGGKPDRTRATQKRLYQLARDITPRVERREGATIQGWIGGLEQLGYGRFQEMREATLTEALRMMARQMRMTNKPAGLWVWDGDHAWVVSGFKATADPAYTDDFSVTAVWVEDPWSGRVSSIWGRGLRPHALLSAKALGADFTPDANRFMRESGGQAMYRVIAPVV